MNNRTINLGRNYMFNLNLKNEDILMKITVIKPVTKKDIIANFVGNLLTEAGGDIANKVSLILSKDTLYLEYKGHAAIGYKIIDGKIYCHPGWENYLTLYSFEDNYQ